MKNSQALINHRDSLHRVNAHKDAHAKQIDLNTSQIKTHASALENHKTNVSHYADSVRDHQQQAQSSFSVPKHLVAEVEDIRMWIKKHANHREALGTLSDSTSDQTTALGNHRNSITNVRETTPGHADNLKIVDTSEHVVGIASLAAITQQRRSH